MDQIEFLKDIWDYSEGQVFLAFKPTSGGVFKYEKFQLPLSDESASRLKETIAEHAPSHHCFYTPAIYSQAQAVTSPTKDAVLLSRISWVDVDDSQTAKTLLEEPPEGASYIISSGGGVHVLWKNDPHSAAELEAVNKLWIETYNGDKGTWNSNRLLRIPGTSNWKYSEAPVVEVRQLNGHSSNNTGPVGGQEEPTAELHLLDLEAIKLSYKLPEKLIAYFTNPHDIPDDRSNALWEITRLCKETAMNIHEAYTVLVFFESYWHKYVGREYVELERILKKEYHKTSIRRLLRTFSQVHHTDSDVEWLITNGVTREGLMILSGPPGVGKTQFSLRAITRAFAENHVIGNFGLKPMKILYLSLEMSEGELALFLKQMKFSPEELAVFDEYITFFAPGESLYLNKTEGQKIFEELIMEVQPELIILDTLGSALSGELTSEEIVRPAMDYLDQTRHKHHTAIWFNHHQRKATADNKKPTKLSDLYGSMYISARATSVFCLYPAKDDLTELEFITLKNRFAPVNPPFILTRTTSLDFFTGSEGVSRLASRVGHGNEQSGSNNGESKAAGSGVGF